MSSVPATFVGSRSSLRRTIAFKADMADPLSIASGLIAIITFTLQSSKVLYEAVESFKNKRQAIRDLKQELQALQGVLVSLRQTAQSAEDRLVSLKLPLICCGKACAEFEAVISRCTSRSGESRTSFRDWAKLQYMGNDIAGFRNVISGYKATISIAIGDANM
jgi:hypothetical protein